MRWSSVKLGDVCKVIPGYAFKSADFTTQGIPLVKIASITDNCAVDLTDAEHWPNELFNEKLSKFLLQDRDILLAMTGATAGKLGRVRSDQALLLNQRVAKIQPFKADPDFIWFLLSSPRYRERFYNLAGGAAQPNMSGGQIEAVEIPLPPNPTQERIGTILSAYDDLIENNRRRMALLEAAARQLYREWFVRFRFPGHEHTAIINGVPNGWEKIYLGDAVDTQYGYTETATDEPVGPKFLRGTDINKTPFIDWSTVPYCPIDEMLQRKYHLRIGDIVIIRMADPGKVAIIEREIDAVFASYLIRLLPTDPRLTPYYLFYVLSDDAYQGFISGVSTGSTRKTASAPLLVDFHLLLATHGILQTFEDSVRPLRQQITTLLIQNEKLRAARDLLLPRLMNGEIAV